MKRFGLLFIIISIFGCSSDKNEIIQEDIKTTSCGNITDIDGNVYPSVVIGTQCWMQKNLDVSKYRNGDPIPQVQDNLEWAKLTTGAWCYFENKTTNGLIYGKLYNLFAVNDPRGIAPIGCHVPSDAEWSILTDFLGGEIIAGGKIKATTGWNSPNIGATNSSGFTALPGGERAANGPFFGNDAYWWSETNDSSGTFFYRSVYYKNEFVHRGNSIPGGGYSVRCIVD